MAERTGRLSRRNFLLTAGAGSVAAAAAIVTHQNPSAPTSTPLKGKRATRGYHSSEHINNYYRTTKV